MFRQSNLLALALAIVLWQPVNLQHKESDQVASPTQITTAQAIQEPQERPEIPQTSNMPSAPENPATAPDVKPQQPLKSKEQPKKPAVVCGPHKAQEVYDILIDIGVPHLAAVQQVGSWTHESNLDQCQRRGDNGVAWGLNSWWPDRRHDMPAGLREQITWAVHTEMPRDCRNCYEQFMAADSTWSVRDAIKRSTRWGILGNRWLYADEFGAELKSLLPL